MATCYHLLYSSATGLVEKDGSEVTEVDGITGTCDDGYEILITTAGDTTTDELLNLSANAAVISATNSINDAIISATTSTLVSADINTEINQEVVNLKVTITIVAKTPIIRTVYDPVPVTPKTDVVKRG